MYELKDTITPMMSDNYKELFKAEYMQTKMRYERLKKINVKAEAEGLRRVGEICDCGRVDGSPVSLLREQQRIMGEYLHILELRAELEGIELA